MKESALLACALCLALFLFWSIVGYAILRALHATRSGLQDLLLAAPVGIVATVIPIWTLSRLHGAALPYWTNYHVDGTVGRTGPVVAGVLLVASLLILLASARRGRSDADRPGIPWRRAWPFALLPIIALAATARPMFAFGFDWVSYCNDDMANYCMSADRFYRTGFFDFPAPDHLLKGTYWPDVFWFMHVMTGQRPGCELLLAWGMSVTGLTAHQVFMPVIVALQLGLVMSAAALVMFPVTRSKLHPVSAEPVGGFQVLPPDQTRPTLGEANDADGEASELARRDGNHVAAWVTGALVAMSALTTLGLMYQLIAQVLGLALLATVAAIALRPFDNLSTSRLLKHGLLLGIMGAGVLIIYPEVVPFLGLSFLLYVGVAVLTKQMRIGPVAIVVGIALLCSVLLLRAYALHSVTFMLAQSGAAKADASAGGVARTQFPYFMIPKGLADLWGIQRLGGWKVRPWVLDTSIVIGLAMSLLTLLAALWMAIRARPVAIVTLVMAGLAGVLFHNRSGFGLFKLAMYLQPFILGTLVLAWFGLVAWITRRSDERPMRPWARAVQVAPLLLYGIAGLRAQSGYVLSSYGVGTSFLEIPDASRTRINAEFAGLLKQHPSERVVSDTFNIVLAKFQSLYTRDKELVFPSNRFTLNIESLEQAEKIGVRLSPRQVETVNLYRAERDAARPLANFDPKDPEQPKLENRFHVNDRRFGVPGLWNDAGVADGSGSTTRPVPPDAGGTDDDDDGPSPLLIVSTGRQSIFNRWHFPPEGNRNFAAVPMDRARNILVFVASDLGQPYFFSGLVGQPSVYQIEEEDRDAPFFHGGTMCGVGRYLMAQVLNPTPKVRMTVSLTLSYHGDGENRLPPDMSVIGGERLNFPVVGRGSARLFSPPIEPQQIEGRSYVMYDLRSGGRQFPAERSGLMKLFGTDVPLDRRILSAFARDVSLVSEEEYANLRPPSVIRGFGPEPSDNNPLRDRQLEYSGIYEDGWVAEDAYARLTQPAADREVVARGIVPLIAGDALFKTRVALSVDGHVVAESDVGLGEFTLRGRVPDGSAAAPTTLLARLPVPPTAPPSGEAKGRVRTVRLQFLGPIQRFAGQDTRPVGAKLESLGFE